MRRDNPEEQDDLHPGPHEYPLVIESAELTIDAMGIYDGDGELIAVRIKEREFHPDKVGYALALLCLDYPGWDAPLDPDTLAELSAAAFDMEMCDD